MACHIMGTLYLPDELIATVRTRVTRTPKGDAIRGFVNEFNGCAVGARRGMARVYVSSATASQTVTCSQAAAVDDTDTLTVGGTVLSIKASPANESQVDSGATNAEFAANMVAAINAHTVISKFCFAAVTTSASGIFTIYAAVPGTIGNFITLAEAGNGFTLGGATLANGACDAIKNYQLGYDTETHLEG